MANIVYIATSRDGFIATEEGGIDWLMEVPNPENSDFGFAEFMERIDALVMGRKTYEKVLSFGGEWPYGKKVFVMSRTLRAVDPSLDGKVELITGTPREIVMRLNSMGFKQLYIDGGTTIQSFLAEDLIDEMIITQVPVTLGKGIALFKDETVLKKFKLSATLTYTNGMVKNTYTRIN
jgi:dihydrofolate reductase